MAMLAELIIAIIMALATIGGGITWVFANRLIARNNAQVQAERAAYCKRAFSAKPKAASMSQNQ